MSVAVYPGSFDPITNGHLDVIRRASALVDRLIVAVLENPRKQPLLSVAERVAAIRQTLAAEGLTDAVTADSFTGLTVNFCRANGATLIVRGLRAISDFETEMQLAHNNRKLAPDVDTLFLMTSLEHGYVSSSLVKEIARYDGDVREMLPAPANAALHEALRREF